ncbi:hypothetical protein KY329_02640 [Candidatus Woesearchaeota archaeon]|nr:hypothetical protein [Candidatus Woesearchaeota archaeon]
MRKIILFAILVFVLPQVYGQVFLSWGDILNATDTNTTMTFSVSVSADLVTVMARNITLDNVTCFNGGRTIHQVFFDQVNTNRDSAQFCVYPPARGGGGSSSQSAATYEPRIFYMTQKKELFTQLRVPDRIIFSLKNIQHSITVTSLAKEKVTLTIESNAKTVTAEQGNKIIVDVDEDGEKDIEITVEEITPSLRVNLLVESLQEDQKLSEIIPTIEEKQPSETPAPEHAKIWVAEENHDNELVFALVAVGFVIILIGMFLFRKRRR